jgi:hypothetical protein
MIENMNSNHDAPREYRVDIDSYGSHGYGGPAYGPSYPQSLATNPTVRSHDTNGGYGREEALGDPYSRDTAHSVNPAGLAYLGQQIEGIGFNNTSGVSSLGQTGDGRLGT